MRRSPITASARRMRSRSRRRAAGCCARSPAACRCTSRAPTTSTQRKLFAPSSPLFFVPQLNFMPAVGLYFVARQPQPGQEMFRVYKLPTTPPKDPFEVRTSTSCTGEVQQSRDAVADRAAEATLPTDAPTPSWTITAHAAKARHVVRARSGRSDRHSGDDALRSHRRHDDRRARAARLRRQAVSRSSTTRRASASISFVRRRAPSPVTVALTVALNSRRPSGAARALDHFAHPRVFAANRFHPRFEARHRLRRCERESTRRSCRP